ncbi:hypothetical protein FDB60_05040, partial [Clostridium botulinum]|nr:hypothetical protein [Clostridium botulinum]
SVDSSNLILIIDNSQFRMSFPDTKLFYEKVCDVYISSDFKDKLLYREENIYEHSKRSIKFYK